MDSLEEVRTRFGHAPRRLGLWCRLTYLRPDGMPAWVRRDALRRCYDERATLFAQGVVVWGALVQANRALFQPGPLDHPGAVLYATDQDRDIDPNHLHTIAQRIYALKGASPDHPGLRRAIDQITDEMARPMGVPIPPEFTAPYRCRVTSVLFWRKHLPDRTLARGIMPIVVAPSFEGAAAVVPARYWDAPLLRFWMPPDPAEP